MDDYFPYDQFEKDSLDIDLESLLEQSLESEEDRLEQELERIKQQLEERESILEENLDELQSKLDWYLTRLEELYQHPTENSEEKDHLKQRIGGFYQEIRKEKRQAWRDKQELEKERRELLRNLNEIKETEYLPQQF